MGDPTWTASPELLDLLDRLLSRARTEDHSIVWLRSEGVFFYFTWDPDKAKAAEEALVAADCLCSHDFDMKVDQEFRLFNEVSS